MTTIIKKIVSFSFAIWTVLILSCAVIIFHFFVILQVIPFQNVWGGKLRTVQEMYVFESISVVINLLLLLIVSVRAQIIHLKMPSKLIDVCLWIFVILFILNTFGNLASETNLETIIATPLTFLFAFMCWRIVTE